MQNFENFFNSCKRYFNRHVNLCEDLNKDVCIWILTKSMEDEKLIYRLTHDMSNEFFKNELTDAEKDFDLLVKYLSKYGLTYYKN